MFLSVSLTKGLTGEVPRVARDGDGRLFYVGMVKKYPETSREIPASQTVLGRGREGQGGPPGSQTQWGDSLHKAGGRGPAAVPK